VKTNKPTLVDVSMRSNPSTVTLEKVGIARFEFSDPYHLAITLSWPQFFALLVAIYLGINLLFALLYAAVPGCISNVPPGSLATAFFFSVETLATVGYGVMAPATRYGHVVSTVEILIGMVLTATMTGLFFVRFSKPKSKLILADTAVLTQRDGRPTLMIRLGNGRVNALIDASARLTMLLLDVGPDGQRLRRAVDLRLMRSDFPYFPMTWTLIHEIDADSPLAGIGAHSAVLDDLNLMLSVRARDPLLGADVFAVRNYRGPDIAFGMRYVNAISQEESGRTVADMRKISEVEPDIDGVSAAPV
jgi:inward rectifier potassium channel